MRIFPTKILLATDGSSEAELATRTAVDLSQRTDSELHVIHVLDIAPSALLYPEATDPEGVEMPDPILEEDIQHSSEQWAGRCSTRKWNGCGWLVEQSHRRI
jgi:nucleotide-binding universal stress UspA family protein